VAIAGIAILMVAGLLVVGLQRSPTQRIAPAFNLQRLDGSGSISSSQLAGAPLVVNFFASSCEPCREEAPVLEQAWRRYRARGIHFLGVNITDRHISARDFLHEYGITYPVVTDYSLTYAQKMKVPGLPVTYFVDKDGRFLSTAAGEKVGVQDSGTTVLGAISASELRSGIEALLHR
jgi:cytochrome c biogenesis protein CcmG, thiol:disulfide interchange protein DsbE